MNYDTGRNMKIISMSTATPSLAYIIVSAAIVPATP
jgi:hypothetical protein